MTEKTVLLVEDSLSDVDLTLVALKNIHCQHKIVVTHDGIEAWDYLMGIGKYAGRDKNDTPIFVLLDLQIPKLDGFELLEKINQDPLLKDVFITVLTSYVEESEKIRVMNLGANLYFPKAMNFKDFRATLQHVESQVLLNTNVPPKDRT